METRRRTLTIKMRKWKANKWKFRCRMLWRSPFKFRSLRIVVFWIRFSRLILSDFRSLYFLQIRSSVLPSEFENRVWNFGHSVADLFSKWRVFSVCFRLSEFLVGTYKDHWPSWRARDGRHQERVQENEGVVIPSFLLVRIAGSCLHRRCRDAACLRELALRILRPVRSFLDAWFTLQTPHPWSPKRSVYQTIDWRIYTISEFCRRW